MTKKFFIRGHKLTIQKKLNMLQTLQNLQDPCNKEEIPDPTLFPAIFKRDWNSWAWNLSIQRVKCYCPRETGAKSGTALFLRFQAKSAFISPIFIVWSWLKVIFCLDFRIFEYLNILVNVSCRLCFKSFKEFALIDVCTC